MKRPDITLSTIQSDGPRVISQSNGTEYVKASPCPVRDGTIEKGEWIAKAYGGWAHRECAEKVFDAASIRSAWTILGADAARRPRAYSTTELRAILEHLVQIAHRDEFDEEFEARKGW